MISDRLFDIAFQYKKTKLWEKIGPTHIFAVKLSDGQIGYITTIKVDGEFHGMCLYIGDEGFWPFRNLWKAGGLMLYDLVSQEEMMAQKCLMCTFEKKEGLSDEERQEVRRYTRSHGIRLAGKYTYPKFWKNEPYCIPWNLQTEEEADWLFQGLSAAVEMANFLEGTTRQEFYLEGMHGEMAEIPMLERKGGAYVLAKTRLPEDEPPRWPEPKRYNEIAMANLKKAKRQGIWQCDLMRLMEPVQDEPDEIPSFPVVFLAVEAGSGQVLPVKPAVHYEEEPEAVLNQILEAFAQQGVCPKKLEVSDERTLALVKVFSEILEVPVAIKDDLPQLEDARLDFIDGGREEPESEFDRILEILADRAGGKLPNEFFALMDLFGSHGLLDDFLANAEIGKPAKKSGRKNSKRKAADESYVISVSLGKGCYRHIRISGKCTLWHLHSAIIDAFDFDDDHAHAFFMDNVKWSDRDSYYTESIGEDGPTTEESLIGSVGLYKGMAFKYIFDFGDEWSFQCKVLKVEQGDSGETQVIKSKGEAPLQYGDLDDDWDDE